MNLVTIVSGLAETIEISFFELPLPVYWYQTLPQTGLAQTSTWGRVTLTVINFPGLPAPDTTVHGHLLSLLSNLSAFKRKTFISTGALRIEMYGVKKTLSLLDPITPAMTL